VALQIDTGKALRRQADLVALIRAVHGASEHDETVAVEWKSELDLSSKAGQFAIARAILGLANRTPDRAATMFEGYGYIVVGASPGSLAGVVSVDPARYAGGINDYVGDGRGPAWIPRHVEVDGVTVAVIEVDPPRPGDPIWPLRKEYTESAAGDRQRPGGLRGAVFVRKAARTDLASDDDIDALSKRAAVSIEVRPDIGVEVIGDLPIPWLDSERQAQAVRHWVDSLADVMLEQAEEEERRRHAPATDERTLTPLEAARLGINGSAMRALADSLSRTASSLEYSLTDTRTLDDYREEVESWRSLALTFAAEQLVDLYSSHGHGAIQVAVTNRSRRFLSDVEVAVTFPWHHATALDDEPDRDTLPLFPRPYGEPPENGANLGDLLWSYDASSAIGPLLDLGRRTWVESGSIKIKFAMDALRPEETETSDTIWVRLPARPDGGLLHGTWRLTAAGLDDVLSGEMSVGVADLPVDPVAVLEAELERDQ
jgi:hypothetical protein